MPSISLMSKFRGMPAKISISAAAILRNIKAVMPAMTNAITKREQRFGEDECIVLIVPKPCKHRNVSADFKGHADVAVPVIIESRKRRVFLRNYN